MNEDLGKLRKVFLELQKVRTADNKKLTQLEMAERLNKDKVTSFSGNPWSKYAVRRMLKRLGINGSSGSRAGAALATATNPILEGGVAGLSDSSPLRQWGFYESIRGVFDELTANAYTEQGLADELNQRGITTVDKRPWDEKSVARALTALSSSSNASSALLALDTLPSEESLIDDAVRARIKTGYYDTNKERFVAVAVKGRAAKTKRSAQKASGEGKAEKTDKKSKKSDKKKKGKKKK